MKILLCVLLAIPAGAAEYAVLNSGFRLLAERHEVIGESTLLHTSNGSVEVPSAEIARFEVEEYTAPAPPKVELVPTVPVPAALSPAEMLNAAARKHGLLPEFVLSVAAAESAFQVKAVSPKGALGLMQLMPGTAAQLGVNPLNPVENAEGGALYLRQLLEKFKHSKDPVRMALAAYNAGPGAVARYRGIPRYRETQVYVERVVRRYLAQLETKKTQQGL